jgi:hypothetical protein
MEVKPRRRGGARAAQLRERQGKGEKWRQEMDEPRPRSPPYLAKAKDFASGYGIHAILTLK